MDLPKAARVIINEQVGQYPAGTQGRIIRVDQRWFTATRYSMLVDSDGGVIEELTEENLFVLDE